MARSLDTDLWWHLGDGRFIFRHGIVPTRDFLSFTVSGHAWHDFEWLSEVVMWALYRAGGLWMLQAGFMVIVVATFGLIQLQSLRLGANVFLAAFLTAAAFVAGFTFVAARPQMISLLMLAVFGLLLHEFRETRNRKMLLLFPILTVLWANCHAGFALGLGLLALTAVGEALNIVTGADRSIRPDDVKWLGLSTVVSIVAVLLNPYGPAELLFPISYITGSPYTSVLNEWSSPDFHLLTMLPFEGLLLLLIGAIFVGRPRLNWVHVLTVLAFTFLALSAIRNIAVWCVVVIPILGFYLQRAAETFIKYPESVRAIGSHRSILNVGLLVATLAVMLVAAGQELKPGSLAGYERQQFPMGAVTYLDRHHISPNLFATYSWSGYAVWRLHPRYRDFIDGRANSVFTNPVLAAYLKIYQAEPGWNQALRHYNVGDVLVAPSAPITSVLRLDKEWRLLYARDGADLFVRKQGQQ